MSNQELRSDPCWTWRDAEGVALSESGVGASQGAPWDVTILVNCRSDLAVATRWDVTTSLIRFRIFKESISTLSVWPLQYREGICHNLSRSKIEPNEARECIKLGNKVRMNGKGWCEPVVRSIREVFVGRNVDEEGTVTMSGGRNGHGEDRVTRSVRP